MLDHFTGKASWSMPAAVYVGLSSTTPTSGGSNVTEPSGGNYARVQVTAAQFTSASSGATETNTDKSFSQANADWLSGVNLTHLVIYDAASSGNFQGFASLAVAKPVFSADTAKINSGDLDMSIA